MSIQRFQDDVRRGFKDRPGLRPSRYTFGPNLGTIRDYYPCCAVTAAWLANHPEATERLPAGDMENDLVELYGVDRSWLREAECGWDGAAPNGYHSEANAIGAALYQELRPQ